MDPLKAIIEGIVGIFLLCVFFGIVFPNLSQSTGVELPGFGLIIGLAFITLLVAIVASVVSAFGGRH